MSKFGKVSDETQELIDTIANEAGLMNFMDIEAVNVPKSKKIVDVKRCPPLGEHVAGKRDVVCVIVYEKAFDRLTAENQEIIMRDAFNNINYDSEKDKITINVPQLIVTCDGYLKWGSKLIDAATNASGIIQVIANEEKEEKERAKINKKSKK